MGWQIDHWIPRTKRGGDTPRNRNAMNTRANLKKGNIHPKTKTFMRKWRAGEFYVDKHPRCQPSLSPVLLIGLAILERKAPRPCQARGPNGRW